MPVAEIIAIGTELLLGEIQDTNTRYLARALREVGIDLYRATLIGDNAARIAQVIQETMQRAQIIITTGGLGPTVDDPARLAVAMSLGVDIEFRPELWQQIQDRFTRYNRKATDNNQRQAYVPQGAIAIENAVGTAPAFYMDTGDTIIISLPGVPREMEYLLENHVIPLLKRRFDLTGIIKALVLHTSGVGESQVDEWVGDLETLSNPTVGLLAHPGIVDIRITAKADSVIEADRMIAEMDALIRQRLGDHIYGIDSTSLEQVVQDKLNANRWTLSVRDGGLDCSIFQNIAKEHVTGQAACNPQEMLYLLEDDRQRFQADLALGAILQPAGEKQNLTLAMVGPTGPEQDTRSYGGSPANASIWARNTTLDFIRRYLFKKGS